MIFFPIFTSNFNFLTLKFKISSLLLVFVFVANLATAQADANKMAKIKIKGVYIYSFAKNVYWPAKYGSGDFIIGIYGDRDIYSQLSNSYTDKLVGSQKIKFKFYENIKDIEECHLLYVSEGKNNSISQLKQTLSNHTLLVSEGQNLAATGSIINFIYIQSRLKYQVNRTKAEKNDLKIGQLLTKLAYSII